MIAHRGKDYYGLTDGKKTVYGLQSIGQSGQFFLGHALHAVIGFVSQPINNCFVANCEIYNWVEVAVKYNVTANNDAELLYKLLTQKGIECLDELDGDYAFAWKNGNRIMLARDIIGVKPLWWYQEGDSLWFASENKALDKKGTLLDPRKILIADDKGVSFSDRTFPASVEKEYTMKQAADNVAILLKEAVRKRVANIDKIAILFSGGIDSTTLATIAKSLHKDVRLYVAGTENSEDLRWAKKIAQELGLPLKVSICTQIEQEAKEVIPIIETGDVMKVSVALPFHFACRLAHEDGCKVILSGLGSEELFAGYQRHKVTKNVNEECLKGLLAMYERDLYRDDTITMVHQLELRLPFLDKALIAFTLSVPGSLKITPELDKAVLRQAALLLGVPEEVAYRKKRAAQYGSGIDKALTKLAKAKSMTKKEYLYALGETNV